jgi:hypothetical protein
VLAQGKTEVRVGNEVQSGDGDQTFFFPLPSEPFAIELHPMDAFPRDNIVAMVREPAIRVDYEGRIDAHLLKALKSDPRVTMAPGGVRVRVGDAI